MSDKELEEKKRYFKRYRFNRICVRRLENKLNIVKDRLDGLKAANISGMPKGGTPVTVEYYIAEKLELEDRIKRLNDRGREIRREILYELDNIYDDRCYEVLKRYFIDCKSIEVIAEELNYSPRQTYRIYKKGVSLCQSIDN